MRQIHELVKSLVREYRTRDPAEIAKQRNAILVHTSLVDIRGFYQYFQRNNIIYIDNSLSESEERFVCAHELGHMLLHKNSNAIYMDTHTCFNTSRYEIEANRFAAELLIPDEDILENYHYTTEQFSRLLGYEKRLIELRLESYQEL